MCKNKVAKITKICQTRTGIKYEKIKRYLILDHSLRDGSVSIRKWLYRCVFRELFIM